MRNSRVIIFYSQKNIRKMSDKLAKLYPESISQDIEHLGVSETEFAEEMLIKINDYRVMLQAGRAAEAGRYHDTLMGELRRFRDEGSDLKIAVGAGAAAGAAASSLFFGVGAVVGGLAGASIGYFTAQSAKERVERLYDLLVAELGRRPAG